MLTAGVRSSSPLATMPVPQSITIICLAVLPRHSKFHLPPSSIPPFISFATQLDSTSHCHQPLVTAINAS
ncbi:unnamed protein product, partial [Citrullus colocynthis]